MTKELEEARIEITKNQDLSNENYSIKYFTDLLEPLKK